MFDKKIFGTRLHRLREEKGMTASQLGKAMGITSTQVGDMEKGNSATSMARLYDLCVFFEVSADYLLGLTEKTSVTGE
ncbi:helix-turn-helix domain-containing protein [Intestinimonas sp.]|uniref:helix-turn-helix domain-containing protein n=1 Tax=Intestinimonas sp. TaxID=1965293 RepID=UPI0026318E3B|nr:helix-turn-helix transcriptional regulator [Intestinimonas sp.]